MKAHVAEGYAIDATRMAEELGNERAANVVLIGALSTALDFSAADWEQALAEFVPKKTIAVNLEAFRLGRSWIEQARTAPPDAQDAAGRNAGAGTPALQRAPGNHAGVVQELRHLRQALPRALPASQ